jgi:hypothetical protein
VIALEHRDGKPGRGYAKVIKHGSAKSLKIISDSPICKKIETATDGLRGHLPLKRSYPTCKQRLSDKGQRVKTLHIQITNFKRWLRGVHSHCHESYMNQCIQE